MKPVYYMILGSKMCVWLRSVTLEMCMSDGNTSLLREPTKLAKFGFQHKTQDKTKYITYCVHVV